MNKDLLIKILSESSAFRNWIANQLIIDLNYPMPSQTIENLLAESLTFQNWAIDQFEGGLFIVKNDENLIDTTLNAVKDSLSRGNKIEAIKGLRDASRDEQIREALLREFSTFVLDRRRRGDDIVYKNHYSSDTHFTLKFSRDLVEHIQYYTDPF